jgi:hypothetical protein
MPVSATLGDYVRQAFRARWNLLAFLGGATAALLSPWPDALLPIVAAGELFYLTAMVMNQRFRASVDAQLHKARQETVAVESTRTLEQVVRELSIDSQKRFQALRARCIEMRGLAKGVRRSTGADDLSTGSLDRLLWMFLRLLAQQEGLARFLKTTRPDEIEQRISGLRAEMEKHQGSDERIVRSLGDSIAAQEMRLDNYRTAQKNGDFVRIELDRIEAKIQALTESAITRQDPDFLSNQIDSVAESMQSTERSIREMEQLSGLAEQAEEPPAILDSPLGRVIQ